MDKYSELMSMIHIPERELEEVEVEDATEREEE